MSEKDEGPLGPVINELLCFIVHKISILDNETIVKLCSEKYEDEEIEDAKDLLFSMVHKDGDSTKFVKRRGGKVSESKSEKNLNDIYQLLQEKGTEELPQFVALDLGNLPPITFNNIDVTVLLTEIQNVKVKVDIMQGIIKKQNEVSDMLTISNNELKKRVESIEENSGINGENNPEGRNNELKSSNKQGESFQCSECDFKSALDVELATHISLFHNRDVFQFFCTKCDYRIDTNDKLVTHMKTHKGENDSFACDVCEYKATTDHNLKLHMATHTGENENFVCLLCAYKCTSQDKYQKHMVTHKGDSKVVVGNDIKEVKYDCDKCGYEATTEDNLKLHKVTHTGENKSFACKLCVYEGTSQDMYKKTHGYT